MNTRRTGGEQAVTQVKNAVLAFLPTLTSAMALSGVLAASGAQAAQVTGAEVEVIEFPESQESIVLRSTARSGRHRQSAEQVTVLLVGQSVTGHVHNCSPSEL